MLLGHLRDRVSLTITKVLTFLTLEYLVRYVFLVISSVLMEGGWEVCVLELVMILAQRMARRPRILGSAGVWLLRGTKRSTKDARISFRAQWKALSEDGGGRP